MTTSTKTPAVQVANGGVSVAVAVVLAWAAGEAGIEVPQEVTGAIAAIIGWAFARWGT